MFGTGKPSNTSSRFVLFTLLNLFLNQDDQFDAQKKFTEYERESNANLLVYAANQSMGTDAFDRSAGRSVFYVTVGQMKHTKIAIKPNNDKVIMLLVLETFSPLNLAILFADGSN